MNEEENLEEGLEDPYEKELREAQEEYQKKNEEGFKDLTEGKIRRKRTGEDDEQLEIPFESRNLARVGTGLAFEVGANTLLDALTLVPGSQAVGSAVINTIAQGIRGGKFSFGEVLGAAAASQIPGLAQGKAITKAGKLTRAVGEGALSGAIDATSIAAVDEGRLPTAQELGLGVGAGGIFGAGFATIGDQMSPKITGLLRDVRARVNGSQTPFVQGSVGAGYIGPVSKGYFEAGSDVIIPLPKGASFDAATVNDYAYRAYLHRANRIAQGGKANLMKGFDETITNKSGQEFILVKKTKLKNKQVPAAFENYDLRSVFDVEEAIVEKLGYEMKQDQNVKFLQLIRRELNNIKQQDPKLYLTNLMEYGDAAYLEHKVARRMAGKFWKRVEAQRTDDINNGLFQWTGATNRNTLENLRLLFDPNYKTLKDTTEARLNKLVVDKKLPDNGEPEGFVITIEDPNEATYSAKDLFVRSNPGNIQVRKAGTGRVVGIIPDFYRQIYSTQFKTAYAKNFGALASPNVDVKIRAQAGETIDQYRDRIINQMLDDAVSGRGVLSEEDYLNDLDMFYNTFETFQKNTGTTWVRKPSWVEEIQAGKNNFADPAEADIQEFNIRDQAGNVIELDVDTRNALRNLKELEDLLRNIPRETTGRFKGSILTSKRKFARELRKDIDAIRRKYNLGEYRFDQKELNI